MDKALAALNGVMDAVDKIPRDMYAILILVCGVVLAVHGFKDEGMLVLGGALAVFKGDK